MRDDLRHVEDTIVAALARGERVDASALLFLLRCYHATGRDDLGGMLGRALAVALEAFDGGSTVVERAGWLALFIEAATLSDDERLAAAVGRLVEGLRVSWTSPHLDEAALSIDACLHATAVEGFSTLASEAIDQLEHIVGGVYKPGHAIGSASDHVRTASTLLTAYSLSGRLPYSMLAEELMQLADDATTAPEFVTTCERARVLCRLAALHDDTDYRAAAVVAPGADYRRDAARLLATQSAEADRLGAAGAIYGVALLELESADSL